MRSVPVHGPTSTDVNGWRELAALAAKVAIGRSRAWRELRSLAGAARHLRMFGQESHGNVCWLLIEEIHAAADSAVADRPLDELARFADEVLKRCDSHAELMKAARHG